VRGKLRDGKLVLNKAITDALLRMVDAIRRMLADIENTGSDGDDDEAELIALLRRLAANQSPAVNQPPAVDPPPLVGTMLTIDSRQASLAEDASPDFALSDAVTPADDE